MQSTNRCRQWGVRLLLAGVLALVVAGPATVMAEQEMSEAELEAERDALAEALAESRAEIARLGEELAELREMSGNAVHIAEQNRLLRERFGAAEALIQEMEAERQRADARDQRRWFLAGATVILIGVLLGLALPRLGVRRRSRWNEL